MLRKMPAASCMLLVFILGCSHDPQDRHPGGSIVEILDSAFDVAATNDGNIPVRLSSFVVRSPEWKETEKGVLVTASSEIFFQPDAFDRQNSAAISVDSADKLASMLERADGSHLPESLTNRESVELRFEDANLSVNIGLLAHGTRTRLTQMIIGKNKVKVFFNGEVAASIAKHLRELSARLKKVTGEPSGRQPIYD